MTSSFLLLSAAVLCLAVYGCVGIRPYAVARKPCEKMVIKKCNVKFRKVFWKAAGKGFRKGPSEFYFYCRALQIFMDCLDESLASCSRGKWLSEYSFVVLEHGMMDKKCGVCPGHRFEHLANSLNARSKLDYVGSEVCPSCAKRVHKKCVKKFLRTLNKNPNVCDDIQAFIKCYKEEGKPEKPCAAKTIVKKFSHLCKIQGERMLIENEIHPGLMCSKGRSD